MAPLHSYRFLSVERQLLTKTLHFRGADIKYNTYCSAGGRCNQISMNSKASLSFFFNNTTKMMQQVGPFCWKFHTGGVFACVPLHATICMSDSIWVAPNETTNGVLGDLPQTSDWARRPRGVLLNFLLLQHDAGHWHAEWCYRQLNVFFWPCFQTWMPVEVPGSEHRAQ